MSRYAIGDHPMTSSERQRRYLAKLAAPKTTPTAADLVVKVDHLRRYPDRIATWLCQRLDRDVVLAFHEALGRALAAAPEEPEP